MLYDKLHILGILDDELHIWLFILVYFMISYVCDFSIVGLLDDKLHKWMFILQILDDNFQIWLFIQGKLHDNLW